MTSHNFKTYHTENKSTGIRAKIKIMARPSLISIIMLFYISTFALAEGGGRYQSTDAWSFGVHGDTQWTIEEDASNPNFVSGAMIRQVNDEFIKHGVKLVIALGDLSDRAKTGAMATRAEFAKPLYDAGIGLFPVRGNHETYGWLFNYAPVEAEIKAMLESFPQTQKEMFGISNLSSPVTLDGKYSNELEGLSYSFDYGPDGSNIRFVILDTEDIKCETAEREMNGVKYPYWAKACTNYPIPSQQEWITDRLNKTGRNTTHAIVLAHRAPMGQNHTDSPFNPNTIFGQESYGMDHNPEGQNAFYDSMNKNGVKLYLGAHDHIHHRSIVKSPDGNSQIQEIIAAGLSTKFYSPSSIPFPKKDRQGNVTIPDQWYGQKSREISLSQEENNIGYYIYTIDGPRLSADYYADSRGDFQSGNSFPFGENNKAYPKGVAPEFHFVKKESFGYSLNGRGFLVAQGESYNIVSDSYGKTNTRILYGFNNSASVDANKRGLTKAVETGWVKTPDYNVLKSDIFSIWGMSELGMNNRTDIYVLSISFEAGNTQSIKKGKSWIATFANGKWVNAVDENFGGKKKFILGKYRPEYGLGTYGIDPKTKTAWAVLNYNADFAVAIER
ncbi:MAG: metallophosphoesterase [Deltaproteobacteria bacterium]|nr:metallophosphoesterase [Deltaproteobacteria bacterium]